MTLCKQVITNTRQRVNKAMQTLSGIQIQSCDTS
ncbi:hypothetical protein V12B01_13405 [Vibrio splendidus 12B01]|nr:hypothetical protein V12B01_13405 [Vibrio splendidus 12B01]